MTGDGDGGDWRCGDGIIAVVVTWRSSWWWWW